MTRFSAWKVPTLFGIQFLSFSISTAKKMFRSNLNDFSGPGTTEQEKLKTGPRWLGWAPKTYPHFLGYNSYRFSSVGEKNVSVEFWRVFRDWAPTAQPKLKVEPWWLCFATQTSPHNLWCRLYSFPSVLLKNNSVEFSQLFEPRYHRGGKKLKTRQLWHSFAPETYIHYSRRNSYRFASVRKINV